MTTLVVIYRLELQDRRQLYENPTTAVPYQWGVTVPTCSTQSRPAAQSVMKEAPGKNYGLRYQISHTGETDHGGHRSKRVSSFSPRPKLFLCNVYHCLCMGKALAMGNWWKHFSCIHSAVQFVVECEYASQLPFSMSQISREKKRGWSAPFKGSRRTSVATFIMIRLDRQPQSRPV